MVAGQVAATDENFHKVALYPTEAELAKKVLELPDKQTKYFGEGTAVVPTMEAGQVVKFAIEVGKWKFLKMSNTYSITDAAGQPFGGGVHIKVQKNVLGKERVVVYDENDQPIALATQDVVSINKKFDVYGTKPLLNGDVSKEKEGDIDFYPWFRVRDIDDNHLEYRSFLIWNGNNYMPFLHIVPTTDKVRDKGKNMVVDIDDKSKVYALMCKTSPGVLPDLPGKKKEEKDKIAGWDVCIAPGGDPLAFLVLAALMDDMVGWFA